MKTEIRSVWVLFLPDSFTSFEEGLPVGCLHWASCFFFLGVRWLFLHTDKGFTKNLWGLQRTCLPEAASRWQQEHTRQEKLQWPSGRKREVVWLPLCGFYLDCHWGTEGIIISWTMKQQGVLQRTQRVESDTPDFESWCHSWQRFWSW